MTWSPQRRTGASRLYQLRTDGTGSTPWIILDPAVKWWQVLGSPSNAAYMVQVRPSSTTTPCAVQVMVLNQYRSDLFVGCPDLQVRITNAAANALYLLAVQGDDLRDGDA